MKSPFACVGLARRNDPNGATAHRVSNDEQMALDSPVKAIACLAILPAPVNLDPPLRIAKGWNHEREM
jgi:hypothetical protein